MTNNAIECNILPPQAADLVNVVIERRLEFLRNGQIGRVTVRDIPTEDPDDRQDTREGSDGAIINLPGRGSRSEDEQDAGDS